MARKRIRNVPVKRNLKRGSKNGIFSRLNFAESYTSLILGAIVALIIGIIFVSFAKVSRNLQTISTKEGPRIDEQSKSNTSSTYTIKPGDDLWSISENVYKDGYKWVEIAKVNKLENPGLIHVGNKLIIPTIAPTFLQEKSVVQNIKQDSQKQNVVMQNNSITTATYTIKPGDNLWDIAVRAYGDGFKWPEIAKANNLENPDLIFSDNLLQIPR